MGTRWDGSLYLRSARIRRVRSVVVRLATRDDGVMGLMTDGEAVGG
jgi:hypothetical protein